MEVALFLCFPQSVHKLLRHMSVEKDRGGKKRVLQRDGEIVMVLCNTQDAGKFFERMSVCCMEC